MAQVHDQPVAVACNYFVEDLVYRINKRGQAEFGVVVESSGHAISEDGEDEGNPFLTALKNFLKSKRLRPGLTKVMWYPKGNTEVVPEKKVNIYDRSLLPGEVVRRADETISNLRGYCKEAVQTLTLKICGLNKIVENVPSSGFIPLSPLSPKEFCLYNSWIGYIESIEYSVTLSCEDGSCLIAMANDLIDFEDEFHERDESSDLENGLYYVGQQLVGPKRSLRKANWLYMTSEMKSYMAWTNMLHTLISVTVVDLAVVSMNVKWLSRISDRLLPSDADSTTIPSPTTSEQDIVEPSTSSQPMKPDMNSKLTIEEVPSRIITGEEISLVKKLNYLHNGTLQVADEGYYVIESSTSVIDYRDWRDKVTKELLHEGTKLEEDSTQSDSQNVDFSDERSQNEESVPSQNSEEKAGSSLGIKQIDEKRPKYKRGKDPRLIEENSRVPVVIVAIKTTVTVIWENGQIEANIPSSALYPVLDNHDFFPGDFIVENRDLRSVHEYGVIQCADHIERTVTVKWFKRFDSKNEPFVPLLLRTEDVSFYDVKRHSHFRYRPSTRYCVVRLPLQVGMDLGDPADRVGHVIYVRPKDGQLLCAWANRSMSYAHLQELHTIYEYDSNNFEVDGDIEVVLSEAVTSSSGSTETASKPNTLKILTPPENLGLNHSGRKSARGGTSAFGKAMTQLGEWFTQNSSHNLFDRVSPEQSIKSPVEEVVVVNECSPEEVIEDKLCPERKSESDVNEPNVCSFELVASVHKSHKFKRSTFQPHNPNTFIKHVSEEIFRLRSSLPSTILVKGYEDRMDLFSVMIQGPASTPYEDGLFFFDMQLPTNYPNSPPLVHYWSYCSNRLNPNLYVNGKVCVSLLGTWSGRGTELWKPGTSSLLQLLVSIQGLILVSEPYYNEPGDENEKDTLAGKEHSRRYNEMVVVKLVQSMTKMVSKPHDAFVKESRAHFEESAQHFIDRLEKWLYMSTNWAAVNGSPEYVIPDFPLLPASQGFCLGLHRALTNFKQALQRSNIASKA